MKYLRWFLTFGAGVVIGWWTCFLMGALASKGINKMKHIRVTID